MLFRELFFRGSILEFCQQLALLLEERNLTAYRVRKDLGLANATMGMWLNSERFPDGKSLIKLADYFNVSIDYLVGRTDNPEVNK